VGIYTESVIVNSLGYSIFKLFVEFQSVFHSACNIIHFHQQWTRDPISLIFPIFWFLFLFFFFCSPVLMDVWLYFIMVLICISLMISETELIFMCLLAICISSLENFLFKSFTHFLIRLFVFYG
jgi:hypothetical protein